VFYNNTWFSNFAPGGPGAASDRAEGSNIHLLNNLFLRQNESKPVLGMITWTNYTSSDYNGFYAGSAPNPFRWASPDFSLVSIDAPADTTVITATPAIVVRSYPSLSEYQAGSHQDAHSILISYADFVNVKPTDPKAPITTLYDGSTLDFRLAPGAPEIGKGVVIPNVAEARNGSPPDMGAVPFGDPLPHYGPRPAP
jgi:hypothetical protein